MKTLVLIAMALSFFAISARVHADDKTSTECKNLVVEPGNKTVPGKKDAKIERKEKQGDGESVQ